MSAELIINTTAASIDQMKETGTIEWIMAKLDQFPIKISFIFACAMVLGSVVPYVPQYFTIKQTQNTEGFSLYVCLTLLVANILRIMFWFGKHFETALLIQSIVMILAMFILLELCVRVRNSNLIIQQKKRYFSDKTRSTTTATIKNDDQLKDSPNFSLMLKRSRSLNDFSSNDMHIVDGHVDGLALNCATLPRGPNQTKASVHNSNTLATSTAIEMNDVSGRGSELGHSHTISLCGSMDLHRPQSSSAISVEQSSTDAVNATKQQQQQQTNKRRFSANASCTNKTQINESFSSNVKGPEPRKTPVPKQTIVSSEPDGNHATVKLEDDFKKQQPTIDEENQLMLEQKQQPDMKKKSSLNGSAKMATNDDPNADEFKKRRLIDFDLRYFWEWTDFMSYFECMAVFTFFAGVVFYLFIDVPLVVEGYGLVALVTESLLASPQFFRNLKVKSTEGMSKLMVLTWFLGDLYKTIYFFVRQAPFQFLICGCTQITFDILIFLQVICYKKASYRKLSKSRLKHLEGRARKRFKANVKTKKMFNLLTTMADNSNCPSSIVATSIHHPQPATKISSTESLEPISPRDCQTPVDDDHCMDGDKLDLIELNGYDNKAATFDSRDLSKRVGFRCIDDDNDEVDFEDIDIDKEYEEEQLTKNGQRRNQQKTIN